MNEPQPQPVDLAIIPQAPTIETLLVTAIERGVPVETMEKLMAMRRELKAEAAKEAYFRALSAFQAACPTIQKHREVKVNGQVRYRYAALEDIIAQVGPLLETHGLSYRFDTQLNNGFLHITCIVSHREGHSEASQFRVPIEKSGRMNYTQEFGSSSTYAKRYCFCNALGILTGDQDDDGSSAGKATGASQSDSVPRDRQRPVQPSKAAPKADVAPKKATPAPDAKTAVDDFNQRCKARLVEVARKSQWPGAWKAYAVEAGWIMPNEELDVIVKNPVPIFKFDPSQTPTANQIIAAKRFQAIQENVEALAKKQAGETEAPEAPDPDESGAVQASECPNCNRTLGEPTKDLEDTYWCKGCGYQWDDVGNYYEEHEWARSVCPIPPKGTTRLEYLKAPQTLGMIARTDNKRFYGIVMNNQEAQGWVGKDGKQRPPSESDKEFATACREAVAHMEERKQQNQKDK